jgi:TRAP-type mannitol/chloroaromatic compound transport system permease small subunit
MISNKRINSFLKTILFFLFSGLISLVVEMAFFNKDFFFPEASGNKASFDYYWIRHVVIFLLLTVAFVFQKKKLN